MDMWWENRTYRGTKAPYSAEACMAAAVVSKSSRAALDRLMSADAFLACRLRCKNMASAATKRATKNTVAAMAMVGSDFFAAEASGVPGKGARATRSIYLLYLTSYKT